jgi:hypothetical protein
MYEALEAVPEKGEPETETNLTEAAPEQFERV